jgi:hypothetical protein
MKTPVEEHGLFTAVFVLLMLWGLILSSPVWVGLGLWRVWCFVKTLRNSPTTKAVALAGSGSSAPQHAPRRRVRPGKRPRVHPRGKVRRKLVIYLKGQLSCIRNRFHADENIPGAVVQELRSLGLEVTTTTQAGLHQAGDRTQLSFASARRSVLLTYDHDFEALARDQRHSGIVRGTPGRAYRMELIRICLLIAQGRL